MSATEDESQQKDEKEVDSGWDDESEPSGDAIDEAWDSEPAAAAATSVPSAASSPGSDSVPSVPVETAEVDVGWDDAPGGNAQGKRRPHRERRAKTDALPLSTSPVLQPRPAQNTKKGQREQARKSRTHEAQLKQQRKLERKAERAAEAREEAEARARQAEAEEQARNRRKQARERAQSERPAAVASSKSATKKLKVAGGDSVVPRTKRSRSASESPEKPARKAGINPIVVALLLAVAAVAAVYFMRK